MKKSFDAKKFISQNSIWLVLIVMVVGVSIARPMFLSANNIETLMTAESVKGVLAFGVMWAILSKGIDLSPGSVVALVSVVCASLAQDSDAVNRLLGEERLDTQAVGFEDRGRHTTTRRELFMLPGGAMVIDTPGMRELGMWDAASGVEQTFAVTSTHGVEEELFGLKT